MKVCAHRKTVYAGARKTRCLACGARFAFVSIDPANSPLSYNSRWSSQLPRPAQ